MKAALAAIVAFLFLLIGWLFLVALLYGIGYVASHACEGIGLMHLFNVLLMWVLGPGFGGFLATDVTPQIFKEIDAETIPTIFISVVVTLAVIMGLMSLLFRQQDKSGIGQFVLFVVQVSTIIIGTKIGKNVHVSNNA